MNTGIVGATGFIGSYLSRHLAGNLSGGLRLLIRNALRTPPVSQAEVLTGDLHSRADCERFVAGLHVIFYLAHTGSPVNSDLDRPTDAAVNLLPLLNLLDAIGRAGTRPHIVYLSSGGAVYAIRAGRVPFRESDLCAPLSSYGILKITAEQYLRLAAERGELTATVLRVGNAYGTLLPEHRMQGFIGVALNHLLHGNPIRVFGNASNVRDYIHLDDICTAAVKAAIPHLPFDVFNVGTGQGHSVREILDIIRECHGAPFPILEDAVQGRWLADWVVLDCSHAREALGWSATIDLRRGIAGMLAAWSDELRTEAAPPV